MNIWNVLASVLSGLIICIPLVAKLIYVAKESIRMGNWNKLVSMLADYMAQAETKIEDNATRKEWVIGMIRTSVNQIDYDLTELEWHKIDGIIDDLCTMAKTVNSTNLLKKEGRSS